MSLVENGRELVTNYFCVHKSSTGKQWKVDSFVQLPVESILKFCTGPFQSTCLLGLGDDLVGYRVVSRLRGPVFD